MSNATPIPQNHEIIPFCVRFEQKLFVRMRNIRNLPLRYHEERQLNKYIYVDGSLNSPTRRLVAKNRITKLLETKNYEREKKSSPLPLPTSLPMLLKKFFSKKKTETNAAARFRPTSGFISDVRSLQREPNTATRAGKRQRGRFPFETWAVPSSTV